MGSGALALDTILSAMLFHVKKWSPELTRTQSRDLLRFVLIRLYSDNRGNLNTASLTISQSALADKIGVTREWCNKLLASLKAEGWLVYSSGRREGGLRTICTFAIGNTLKRLLIMLMKSQAKKAQKKYVVKSPSQVFPFSSKKHISFILQKENEPPTLEVLAKIPLLQRWLRRGNVKTEGSDACAPS
jgi:hypothetical protein